MVADDILQFETTYQINYQTDNPIPISEIVDSLKSIEKLIHRTPAFLEKQYSDIKIVDVLVYVDTLKAGSLKEKFVIKYFFKGQENYERAKEVLDTIMENSNALQLLTAAAISGLATYGILQSLPSDTPTQHIEAYDNIIINTAGTIDFKSEDFRALLNSMPNKKQLAQDAIKMIKPAKGDPDAKIEINDTPELTITNQFIAKVPGAYEPPMPDEKAEQYSNANVHIFASDRDKQTVGWAGILPGVVDARTAIILADEVDPNKLHGHRNIRADVTVHSKFNKQRKKYIPAKIEIRKTNVPEH